MGRSKSRRPFVLLLVLICAVGSSSGASESETLLKFKDSLSNDTALNNWNASISPCTGGHANWVGVLCSDKGTVRGLQLEDLGLMGLIDVNSLVDLPYLRTMSFMNNNFDGPMPDIKKLGALKSVFLSNNRFSGEIPKDAFEGMKWLNKAYLEGNGFRGNIPESLAALPKLSNLSLAGNHFEGEIPEFKQRGLSVVNLANNDLEGPIPESLSKMNASFFLGNKGLCGKPLDPCKSTNKQLVQKIAIVIVIAVGVTAIIAMFASFCLIRGRRTKTAQFGEAQEAKVNTKIAADDARKEGPLIDKPGLFKKGEKGQLHFARNERQRFELHDLLRASAEVLGSGSFGSSYKALLMSGPAMVVKRFRQMNNVGKEEFHKHMRRLGSLSHPNLLHLVAFYCIKEEKLLVSDFVENGSLATHLHGGQNSRQPRHLDWPTRLRIIKGVAMGLAYLHKELPTFTLPHGHLKSSNVLLDCAFQPLLTDYALAPVTNKEHAKQVLVAYKSPEFTQSERITRKTDVWSLGILILEMLTGKFPANYNNNGDNSDLASWVNSVVREEWTGEVFDKEMRGTRRGEGEMLKLLKIGLCCCEWNVEKRWGLREAVERIEELNERDGQEDYSSYASEGDMYSSRGAISDDDFSFSVNK